jgi:hypothetical protein
VFNENDPLNISDAWINQRCAPRHIHFRVLTLSHPVKKKEYRSLRPRHLSLVF